MWLITHCSCGGHVQTCKRNIAQAMNIRYSQKTGGTSDKNTRYKVTRDAAKEAGIPVNGRYGFLYNPENKKWTSVFQDDRATRKERILAIQ